MRFLNHVYGFGAKHELLRAGIFGRGASRCLLLTFVGATKCLSLCVMKWTFIQCEQFVELTLFIGKEDCQLFVFLRARTTTCVLLSCEEANWDLLCNAMGSSSCCWRQHAKTEELYVCFLTGLSNSVCLMWILWLGCEAKILQSPFHRVQSSLRKPGVLWCCFLNKSVDLGCMDFSFASLVDCEAANFREQEERILFKVLR